MFQTCALNEFMVDLIYTYKFTVELFNLQYKALMTSAREETSSMERNYNAVLLSRVGFIVEDIRLIEGEIIIAITNRSIEIENPTSECILSAQGNLDSLLDGAGESISTIVQDIMTQLYEINESLINPHFNDGEFLISLFEVEILTILGYYNGVTSMFTILLMLESEIRTYGVLFEYFVSSIYVDMIYFGMFTDGINANAFPQLETVVSDFRATGNSIISSLIDCN